MAHLQQQQEMNVPKLEVDSMSAVPTSQVDQSHQMNYHPQQAQQPGQPAPQQQQPAPSSETMNIKKFYDNDDEDTVIDEHFTKSFSPESRARCKFFAFVWKKGPKKTSGMNLHIKKPGNQVGHLVWLSRGGGGGACPNQPNTFRALISLTPLFTAVINGITRVRVFMSIVYNIKGGARLTPEMYQCFTGWPLERG